MREPRILFVKLSSLGDVVHHLPAVTDLARQRPGAHVAWDVEEAYVDVVKLHPAIAEAIPINLRSLRRNPLRPSAWRDIAATRRALRRGWDYVVDSQGLLKSAFVSRLARAPAFGPDAMSARERLAARFYDVKIAVPRTLHAVERNRRLVAEIFGYSPDGPQGLATVFPGGSAAERAGAARLAAEVPLGLAAPAMPLAEAAALLAHADGVVGVDTGLTHLAVALDVPTVGIYCATRPELTGLHGGAHALNVGGAGNAPGVEAVAAAIGFGAREE